ncbi:tetrahydrodipicolinate N-succinyltransferase N-terminal domain-containing protein [Campylobacter canadensis]|uniref:Tetrahydrodipicolinate N-succinyltransferase N-terminal domain-containing protein n=1 Tax=Campylobacter canadensis TaxID=449520 RepID=A0ABS7WT13_9BACT|nr:tetrahydrodipicolinate N-succinyltransferase N-terminal domain-containing protein [Campylobacter canadensis]MBZ7987918.1 tetrahydrodipicolinate N-succinyltransferase N-terminal domain-containing protein [Campylobacter canadensis]MBZ7995394.1 tetrahydrodipicolinate N-succinyltransferase N-terminal domain-containing protein [Campylobacter canadensis]MBZ7997061.1 tetrahydrodipicolinate N-succinyltransferase N-terminal domain-containing protein [Campylobacter canadensis]MBZ7998891.1 tetrahydrodi
MNTSEFTLHCEQIQANKDFFKPLAFALGVASFGQISKKMIYIDFANVNYMQNYNTFSILFDVLKLARFKDESEFELELKKEDLEKILSYFQCFENDTNKHTNIEVFKTALKYIDKERFFLVVLNKDENPQSLSNVYIKLHLLSRNYKKPRELNLTKAFAIMPCLAWSDNRAYELEYLKENEIELKFSKTYPNIDYIDKFPRFLQSIIPQESVRITDSSKVRLGAHLAKGSTIMPGASYVNFNAGTLGAAMVEGRISSSVIVGEDTDIGGGASILGVLSGTDGSAISIGKRCLLGANSVTGICLGDDCVVDASVAVLSGMKFKLIFSEQLQKANPNFSFDKEYFKARELSNLNGLHFRQDSISGAMIVSFNQKLIQLNKDLH